MSLLHALLRTAIVLSSFIPAATCAEPSLPRLLGLSRSEVDDTLSKYYVIVASTTDGRDYAARHSMLADPIKVRFLRGRCGLVNYNILEDTSAQRVLFILNNLLPNENWAVDTQDDRAKLFRDAWRTEDGRYSAYFNDFRGGDPAIRYEIVRHQANWGLTVLSSRYEDYLKESRKKIPRILPPLPTD
jgi:hypothetical protein